MNMFKSLEKFVTNIEVTKIANMSSKELEVQAKSFCENLIAGGIIINKISGLKESTDLMTGEVKSEVISLGMGNGFMNLTAARSIYFKSGNRSYNVAKITASGLDYSDQANGIFEKIKTFQKSRLS